MKVLLASICLSCICMATCDLLQDLLSVKNCSMKEANVGMGNLVILDMPIVFYGQTYSSLWVNNVGIISFNDDFTFGFARSNQDVNFGPYFGQPILTPLWTRPYDGTYCYWMTTNTSVIDKFDELLVLENNFRFLPSLLFVVTWKNITYFNNGTHSGPATFAVMLASDGKISFAQFLYTNINEGIPYLIGFSDGDVTGNLLLVNNTGPLSPADKDLVGVAYRIDGTCITPATSACNVTSFAEVCTPLPNVTSTCNCSDGYEDIDIEDNMCRDKNECKDNTNNCMSPRQCLNTIGSFTCCSPGYEGDEETKVCIDINECEENATICPSNAECFNTNGSYVCCNNNEDFNTTSETCMQIDNTAMITAITVGVILPVILIFGSIVVLLIIYFLWNNRQKRRMRMMLKSQTESHEYLAGMDQMNVPYNGSMFKLSELPKSLKIPFEELEIESKMIGEGEFGIVYKAKYQNEAVAIKVLKGVSRSDEVKKVVEEIIKMKHFSHPNILSLAGVSIDHHNSPCIVMPYMWNGSLDSFLRKEENKQKYLFPPDTTGMDAEVDDAAGKLLNMCLQIANAMAYLSSHKIVHRDLAARNCMVTLHNVIKVADFGLSVSLTEDKDYFRLSGNRNEKLPWKWMAIETFTNFKFSEASDVWSFGITCWEIFNGGGKPYPGVKNRDIMNEVLEGYRMDKPPNRACTEPIYQMIKSCWERDPGDRPSFSGLVEDISLILQEMKEYLPVFDRGLNTNEST